MIFIKFIYNYTRITLKYRCFKIIVLILLINTEKKGLKSGLIQFGIGLKKVCMAKAWHSQEPT